MWQNPLDLKIPQHYQFSYYQFYFSNKKYHEVISRTCCCKRIAVTMLYNSISYIFSNSQLQRWFLKVIPQYASHDRLQLWLLWFFMTWQLAILYYFSAFMIFIKWRQQELKMKFSKVLEKGLTFWSNFTTFNKP